jgi:hypothetical protein
MLRSSRGAGTAACRADAHVSAGERSSPRPRGALRRPQEWGRGTHECARHAARSCVSSDRPQPVARLKPAPHKINEFSAPMAPHHRRAGDVRQRRAQRQEKATCEFATSGIRFDVRVLEGAYLRQQGYSEIPEKFLARGAINLFVTDTLGYDIDRDRTGGCSMGPRPPSRRSGGDPFLQNLPGLAGCARNHVAA